VDKYDDDAEMEEDPNTDPANTLQEWTIMMMIQKVTLAMIWNELWIRLGDEQEYGHDRWHPSAWEGRSNDFD
jgi:hypothetical protein